LLARPSSRPCIPGQTLSRPDRRIIIDLAKTGESDPKRLCEAALKAVPYIPSSTRQPPSGWRFIAGAAGFMNFSQSGEGPDRSRDPSRFETIPSPSEDNIALGVLEVLVQRTPASKSAMIHKGIEFAIRAGGCVVSGCVVPSPFVPSTAATREITLSTAVRPSAPSVTGSRLLDFVPPPQFW
jgi:hypothetical protein